jgi:fatty acid/phospholipid biosynthesis enzyme
MKREAEMKISVYTMGGDYAPEVIIKGAVMAAREFEVRIVLVGPQERIKAELDKYDTSGLEIEIEHKSEFKHNVSGAINTRPVKEGLAEAAEEAVGKAPEMAK